MPLQQTILAVTPYGNLLYYVHKGAETGAFEWAGPTKIGHGFSTYKSVFVGDQGVVYGLARDQTLRWYRFNGWEHDKPDWTAPMGKIIGRGGWSNMRAVFSGDAGVVYAIDRDEQLLWYRGEPNGEFLHGPKTVGHGWGNIVRVFAGAAGVIYGITKNGDRGRFADAVRRLRR